jgi:peptidoglycan/xylan/chitin deacetylase (PgdA/CDA1 family)
MTFALIYHDVAQASEREATGFPGPLAARYKLDPERFSEHLDAIAATGVQVGLWDPGAGSAPQAAITFDDGGASALAAAAALERRGWRGQFFVTTGRIGTPGFLDDDGVRALAAAGHQVGSHSVSHPTYMGSLPRAELLREWTASREHLGDLIGTPPTVAAVPGGFITPAVFECAAEAGYSGVMTSQPSARPLRASGIAVQGRYTIWSTTPARQAAGYARGALLARGRLWAEWTAKQRIKRLSPGLFEAGRRLRARRS